MSEKRGTDIKEYFGALWRYLQSPKVVFDIKDRGKALMLFFVTVILLQGLVKIVFT